jgi:hypothetical protein
MRTVSVLEACVEPSGKRMAAVVPGAKSSAPWRGPASSLSTAAERRRRLRDRFQVHEGRARVGHAQHHVGRVRDVLHRRLNGALRADEAGGLEVERQPMAGVDGEDVAARRVREGRAVLGVAEDGHADVGEPEPVRADDAPRDPGYRHDVDGARRDAGLHQRLGLEQERQRVVERGRDGGIQRAARRAHERAARIAAVDRAGVAVVHDIGAGDAAAASAFAPLPARAPAPSGGARAASASNSAVAAEPSLTHAAVSADATGSTETACALRHRAALPCASVQDAAGAAAAEAAHGQPTLSGAAGCGAASHAPVAGQRLLERHRDRGGRATRAQSYPIRLDRVPRHRARGARHELIRLPNRLPPRAVEAGVERFAEAVAERDVMQPCVVGDHRQPIRQHERHRW